MGIFQTISDLLDDGESLTIAIIVSRSGSAPRVVGSRMVVREDGAIVGTIGGGTLEAGVRDLAAEVFGHRQSVLKKYLLTDQDACQMGMVCGGVVQILVHYLDAALMGNPELYREIVAALDARTPARLITEMPSIFDVPRLTAQFLIRSDRIAVGDLEHNAVQAFTAQAMSGKPEVLSYQGKEYLVESLCHESVVYIFGAGHVSQQLAPLTKKVGFRTVVLDDRQEFANRERFPDADKIIVVKSFELALEGLEVHSDSYMVLVTRGHAHDQTVLRQALVTEAGYIGMIGSRHKRGIIYAALQKNGFSPMDFNRVFSPIGLAIGAETPEEIAVSIVAELIQVRAEKNR
jgi:xanthine dehydrogenase accessory factor